MTKMRLFSITLELVGVAVIGVGIGIQLATQANVASAILTAGSCLVAMGGVIWGKFVCGPRPKGE